MKNILIFIALIALTSCTNTVSEAEKQKEADRIAVQKEAIETIRNDLKLIRHNSKFLRKDGIDIFNETEPKLKGKDDKPFNIMKGAKNIDELANSIEMSLKKLD